MLHPSYIKLVLHVLFIAEEILNLICLSYILLTCFTACSIHFYLIDSTSFLYELFNAQCKTYNKGKSPKGSFTLGNQKRGESYLYGDWLIEEHIWMIIEEIYFMKLTYDLVYNIIYILFFRKKKMFKIKS